MTAATHKNGQASETQQGLVGIESDIVRGIRDVHYGHAQALVIATDDMRIRITRTHIACHGSTYTNDYTHDCEVSHYKQSLVVYLWTVTGQQATLFIERNKLVGAWTE